MLIDLTLPKVILPGPENTESDDSKASVAERMEWM